LPIALRYERSTSPIKEELFRRRSAEAAIAGSGAIAQQQPRQSGDVHGDAPRLILGKSLVHGAPLRVIIEIDVSEMLSVRVGNNEAFFELFD
jgi:hypothetical protein